MVFNVLMVVVLVALSGTFAGLTLALFSLKLSTLETKIRLGDRQAKKVYALRKNSNLLLATLLLGNVASYTIMAIFLGSITSEVVGGFIATALIFVFGEILPQAIFPRYALKIGASLSWLVWGILVIFYPISAPIAWALDKILGKEPVILWSKEELGEIIKYHEDVGDGIIDRDEERIILGALSFSEKTVVDIMIPQNAVFYLDAQGHIDKSLLNAVKNCGHTRIPLYDDYLQTITGILYTKNLIGADFSKSRAVSTFGNSDNLLFVHTDTKLDKLLNLFLKRKMHMALVNDASGRFVGIATLEDVMEEILKTEIEDRKE